MNMRRKILLGVVALTLPATSVALLSTPALAKKPPPNPITCTGLAGTVTFALPGLSSLGAVSSSKTSVTTVSNIVIGACSQGSGPNSGPGLSVTNKSTKNPKVKGQPRTYTYDTFTQFITTGPGAIKKSVKTLTFTINGNGVTFKNKGVVGTACANSEVGFLLTGQVKAPPYNVAGNTATVLACLGGDAGPNTTNNFGADLGSSTPGLVITTAQIDPATSQAVL